MKDYEYEDDYSDSNVPRSRRYEYININKKPKKSNLFNYKANVANNRCAYCNSEGESVKLKLNKRYEFVKHYKCKKCFTPWIIVTNHRLHDRLIKEKKETMKEMMKKRVIEILSAHNCKLIEIVPECKVVWENQNGTIMGDDIVVLTNMSEAAWEYWATC